MKHINWYPGHMKKTRELIQENLKVVDAVIEVIDARIPVSSRNPIIDDIIKEKKRVVVLNKMDLADEAATSAWAEKIRRDGHYAVAVNCSSGADIAAVEINGPKKVTLELKGKNSLKGGPEKRKTIW